MKKDSSPIENIIMDEVKDIDEDVVLEVLKDRKNIADENLTNLSENDN